MLQIWLAHPRPVANPKEQGKFSVGGGSCEPCGETGVTNARREQLSSMGPPEIVLQALNICPNVFISVIQLSQETENGFHLGMHL